MVTDNTVRVLALTAKDAWIRDVRVSLCVVSLHYPARLDRRSGAEPVSQ